MAPAHGHRPILTGSLVAAELSSWLCHIFRFHVPPWLKSDSRIPDGAHAQNQLTSTQNGEFSKFSTVQFVHPPVHSIRMPCIAMLSRRFPRSWNQYIFDGCLPFSSHSLSVMYLNYYYFSFYTSPWHEPYCTPLYGQLGIYSLINIIAFQQTFKTEITTATAKRNVV